MNPLRIAEFIFVGTFVGMLVLCALILSSLLVNGIVAVVRIWKPNFADLPREDTSKSIAPHVIKMVALDFILQRKIHDKQKMAREIHERERQIVAKEETHVVAGAVARPRARIAERKDVWAICRFPRGMHTPSFLIHKVSVKGEGLKTAFAPIASKRLTMDLASAQRWCEIIPDSFVVPGNASARQHLRMRNIAAKLQRVEEHQNAQSA